MAGEAGLKIWSEDGSKLLVGPGTSLVKGLGWVTTGKSNGSFSHPELASGAPAVIAMIPVSGASLPTPPEVSFSGNTVYWTFEVSGASYNTSFNLLIGVY